MFLPRPRPLFCPIGWPLIEGEGEKEGSTATDAWSSHSAVKEEDKSDEEKGELGCVVFERAASFKEKDEGTTASAEMREVEGNGTPLSAAATDPIPPIPPTLGGLGGAPEGGFLCCRLELELEFGSEIAEFGS